VSGAVVSKQRVLTPFPFRADAATGDAVDTFGDFVMEVAGRKDGPRGVAELGFVEASL
jgi:hypothetical protein